MLPTESPPRFQSTKRSLGFDLGEALNVRFKQLNIDENSAEFESLRLRQQRGLRVAGAFLLLGMRAVDEP